MKIYKFLKRTLCMFCVIVFVSLSDTKAQYPPYFIITEPIYDTYFNSRSGLQEKKIALTLFPYTLRSMAAHQLIKPKGMRDLALPLGIHGYNGKVDFKKGMKDMWEKKERWIEDNNYPLRQGVIDKKEFFIQKLKRGTQKTTIRNYRDQIIEPATERTQALHKKNRKNFSVEKALFLNIITANLSPNVMLGYNIQELLPVNYQNNNTPINPLFKVYYFDRLLREGGIEFVEGFPARYDSHVSFGPFQITDFAIKGGILENRRLIDEFKIYKSIKNLRNIEEHAFVAAFNSYNNWEIIAFVLEREGLLKKFNSYFGGYRSNESQKRTLRIFIAGITACMHHEPTSTRRAVVKFIKENKDLKNIHYEILTKGGLANHLRKYYRSAAEAYLIMKVYHKYEEMEINNFIQKFIDCAHPKHLDNLLKIYSNNTNYFNRLSQTKQQIRKEKEGHYTKWPEKEYKLIEETTSIKHLSVDKLVLKFDFNFVAKSSMKEQKGRATSILTLQKGYHGYKIIGQKETNYEYY